MMTAFGYFAKKILDMSIQHGSSNGHIPGQVGIANFVSITLGNIVKNLCSHDIPEKGARQPGIRSSTTQGEQQSLFDWRKIVELIAGSCHENAPSSIVIRWQLLS